jgi:hypothetical protein
VKKGGSVAGGSHGQALAHEEMVRGDPSCWEEEGHTRGAAH